MAEQPISRLITMAEVMDLTSIRSRTTVYRLARQGRFPMPRTVSDNCIRWLEDEVRAWLADLPMSDLPIGDAAASYGPAQRHDGVG